MDKIEEILKDSFNVEVPDEYMGIVAREIRQQIGRELLDKHPTIKGAEKVFTEKEVREVCKLEEE